MSIWKMSLGKGKSNYLHRQRIMSHWATANVSCSIAYDLTGNESCPTGLQQPYRVPLHTISQATNHVPPGYSQRIVSHCIRSHRQQIMSHWATANVSCPIAYDLTGKESCPSGLPYGLTDSESCTSHNNGRVMMSMFVKCNLTMKSSDLSLGFLRTPLDKFSEK